MSNKNKKDKKHVTAMKIETKKMAVPCVCTQCGVYVELEDFEAIVKIKCKPSDKISNTTYKINKEAFLIFAKDLQNSYAFKSNFMFIKCANCGSDMLLTHPSETAKLISILHRDGYRVDDIIESTSQAGSPAYVELHLHKSGVFTSSPVIDPIAVLKDSVMPKTINNGDSDEDTLVCRVYEISCVLPNSVDANDVATYIVKFYQDSKSTKKENYTSVIKIFTEDYKKSRKSIMHKISTEILDDIDLPEEK